MRVMQNVNLALVATSIAGVLVASATAATVQVNTLGASSGRYADDVRTSAGVYLNGTNSSYQPYFQGALPSSTASDALIAQQLFFTDSGSASGGGAGLGSLNNTFTSAFRWYMDPYSTSRTVALNLLVLGTNGMLYSMSYVGEGAAANAWNTFEVDANTATTDTTNYGWRVYSSGTPGSSGSSKSLAGWLTDATWGSILNDATVLGQGFNIGSYQRNCRVGIDWLESTLLNGGDRVEFGVVPAPGAIALLGMAGLVGRRRRG